MEDDNTAKLENEYLIYKLISSSLIKEYFYSLICCNLNLNDLELNKEYSSNLYLELKEIIQTFEETYKLHLIIPLNETTIEIETFKIKIIPANKISLNLYLPFLLFELSLYPKSFIQKSNLQSITLVEEAYVITDLYNQYRAAIPEYYLKDTLYYSVRERNLKYILNVIHHELFHFIDFKFNKTFEDKNWSLLNTKDFKYGKGGHTEREFKTLDKNKIKGFLNFYSTTAVEEDKAEIFSELLSNFNNVIDNEDSIIVNKGFALIEFLENFDNNIEWFNYLYNINIFRSNFFNFLNH